MKRFLAFTSACIFVISLNFTAFAYTTSWAPIVDWSLPASTNPVRNLGDLVNRKSRAADKELGILTLNFNFNEIGQDFEGVILLAKKEAATHGGNTIYSVSSTEYKDTHSIANATFRVVCSDCLRVLNGLRSNDQAGTESSGLGWGQIKTAKGAPKPAWQEDAIAVQTLFDKSIAFNQRCDNIHARLKIDRTLEEFNTCYKEALAAHDRYAAAADTFNEKWRNEKWGKKSAPNNSSHGTH